MHHIEIYVSNLKRSYSFYTWLLPKLGFTLYQEWDEGFSYRKKEWYIVFVQVSKEYAAIPYHRRHVGLNHLAFSCDSQDLINELREELIKNNVLVLYDERYPYAGGKEHYALFFEDPDRIKLEIVWSKKEE